jgi:hypothetical protein
MPKPADLSVTGLRRRYVLTPHRHLSLRSRFRSERGSTVRVRQRALDATLSGTQNTRSAWRGASRTVGHMQPKLEARCGRAECRRAHAEAARGCAASGHAVSLFWPQRWRRRCARNCSRRRRRDVARDVASESRDGVAAVGRAELGYVEAAALSKRVCLARRRPRPPESRFDDAPRRGVGGRRCG